MWRQSRNSSWMWLAVVGALLLASPQGRRTVARWARAAARWLEDTSGDRGMSGSDGKWAMGEVSRSWDSGLPRRRSGRAAEEPGERRSGGEVRSQGERHSGKDGLSRDDRRGAGDREGRGGDGQVMWWVTKPADTVDGPE
ncbi:MAG: hypothetical protein QJR01_00150 [Kyrpidia sp.]|nr:hypothetical protein [Kyrpidia sp.]